METLAYTLSSFTKIYTDLKANDTFTATATGTPVFGATVTAAALYLSSIKVYTADTYLNLSLNGASGATTLFPKNEAVHAETVALSSYNGLLSAGSGTITFTVRRTSSSAGNAFNLRDNVTGAIVLHYDMVYTECGAPTTVSVYPGSVAPGAAATLSWQGAVGGQNNPIAAYTVFRATAATGPYTALDTTDNTSLSVQASMTGGASYYYKVAAMGSADGTNGPLSTAYAVLQSHYTATPPPTPVIASPAAGATTHGSKPRVLVEVGAADSLCALTLSCYSASSAGYLVPGARVVLRREAALSASGSQTVSVVAATMASAAPVPAIRGFSYSAPAYTDPTLIPRETRIRAKHINELRTMVDTMRAYYGMVPTHWGEGITANVTSLADWRSHVLALRASMEEIAAVVNAWDANSTTHNIQLPAWIDIPVNTPTVAVMAQLRGAIALL